MDMPVIDELLVRVGANLEPLEEAFEDAGRTTRRFTDKIQRYGKKLDRMRVTPVVRLTDRASPQLQKLEGKLRYFGKKTFEATVRINDRATRGVDKLRSKMGALKTPAMVGGIASGLIGYDTIRQYAVFEQEMANVRAITGATNEEFAKMNKLAKEEAGRTMFSPKESAEAMRYLGMAGFETKEIIGALPGMLDLAASAQMDLGRAADISSNILTGFNLKASESKRVADVLAKTITSANVNMEELGNTMSYVAPVAASVGVSLEQAAAAAGALGNAGIKGSKAGTTLRTALIRLSDPPKEALTQMQKLGIEIENEEGKFKSLGTILADFKKATEDMGKAEKLQAISQIFGRRAASGMLKLIKESGDEFDNLVKKLNEAGGTASDVADTRMDTLSGSLRLLYSRVQLLQIAIGEELGPIIRDFSDWLREQVPYIKDWAEKVMPKLADGIRKASERFQGFVKSLRNDEEFQNLDWAGKVVYVLNEMTDAMSEWLEGEGGDAVQRIFTQLAEIAGKAWLGALKSILVGGLKNLGEGDLAGAGGMGLLFYLLGGGALLKGAGALFKGAGKAGSKIGASGAVTAARNTATTAGNTIRQTGKLGTLSKVGKGALTKIGFPLMVGGEIINVATAEDKTKAATKSAGSLGGAWAGGAAGAAAGSAIFPGVGTIVGGGIGGLAGYFGGKKLTGGIYDWFTGGGSNKPPSKTDMMGGGATPQAIANNLNGDINFQVDNIPVNIENIENRIEEDRDQLAYDIGNRVLDGIKKHIENSADKTPSI